MRAQSNEHRNPSLPNRKRRNNSQPMRMISTRTTIPWSATTIATISRKAPRIAVRWKRMRPFHRTEFPAFREFTWALVSWRYSINVRSTSTPAIAGPTAKRKVICYASRWRDVSSVDPYRDRMTGLRLSRVRRSSYCAELLIICLRFCFRLDDQWLTIWKRSNLDADCFSKQRRTRK